jgi:two-component system, chemotaxis family, protein-glutamate methylesterase/glutaminase
MKSSRAIVIGASSGGVSALLEVAAALPAGLQAAVGVVLHVGSQRSILPELLAARCKLPARHPMDGEPLAAGTIYVAPPDYHMLFTQDTVRLSRGPRENHARPALDPLFRATALTWGPRAIGVVLTGELDDGTAGLAAIKECGGTAMVQDPATALAPSMPASAVANVAVDYCLPLPAIAPKLVELVGRGETGAAPHAPQHLQREQAIFEGRQPVENLNALGTVSSLTCPDCGGGLWELSATRPLRYRCHTGHAFTSRSLESAQLEQAEHSLWSSVRALQEREMLLRRLANVAELTGDPAQAEAGRNHADKVRAQAQQLARLVEQELNGA